MIAKFQTQWTRLLLPGVGRKTANVVLNIGFGKDTFAVDTHVFRISNRTGLAPGKTVLDVEKKLDRRVPEPYRIDASLAYFAWPLCLQSQKA